MLPIPVQMVDFLDFMKNESAGVITCGFEEALIVILPFYVFNVVNRLIGFFRIVFTAKSIMVKSVIGKEL